MVHHACFPPHQLIYFVAILPFILRCSGGHFLVRDFSRVSLLFLAIILASIIIPGTFASVIHPSQQIFTARFTFQLEPRFIIYVSARIFFSLGRMNFSRSAVSVCATRTPCKEVGDGEREFFSAAHRILHCTHSIFLALASLPRPAALYTHVFSRSPIARTV